MIQPETRAERWALYLARQARRPDFYLFEAAFLLNAAFFAFVGLIGRHPHKITLSAISLLAAYLWFERRQFAHILARQDQRIAELSGESQSAALHGHQGSSGPNE